MADKRFHLDNPIVGILDGEEREPTWAVPNLIAKGTMVLLVADAGAGKSSLMYTISLAIASGVKALSGLVPARTPQRVIYFDQENSGVDRDKYLRRAFFGLGGLKTKDNPKGLELDLLQENFWPVHFHLGDEDWFDRAAECIDYVNQVSGPPDVLVFDTATSCFAIQDENDNGEAGEAARNIRKLMTMAVPDDPAASLVMKHAKSTEKGAPKMMRGAKNWKGIADSVLFQVRAPGRPREGLSRTRLQPDKVRAYGLPERLYITPEWTDDERTGLILKGSYQPDHEHKVAEEADEDD